MKKLITIIAALAVCLTLSGCDFNIASVDSLMRPPKLSGDSSLLQNAFENSVNHSESIIMKTPMSGDNRSSYLFYDLDNDEIQEAFVFYSDPAIEDVAYASVFKKIEGNWSCVSNIKGRGEDIYEVNFADINGDGIKEFVISWNSTSQVELASFSDFGSSRNRTMTIYSYNGSALTLIKTEVFTKAFVDDLNGDNADELFVLNIYLSNQTKNTIGRIISFNSAYEVVNEEEFTMTGMLEILNIVTDNYIFEDKVHTRLYIDGLISETGVVTEVIDIAHSDFAINLPLYQSNISEAPLTLRDVRTSSQDIDNDGNVEIPTLETLTSGASISGNSNEAMPLNLTVWSEVNETEVVVDFKCLLNSTYGYMFIFPEESIHKLTVVYNTNTTTLTFHSLDENGTLGGELFSVRAFSKLNWDENDFGYTKLDEKGAYVYGYMMLNTENAESIIKYITRNFVITEQV